MDRAPATVLFNERVRPAIWRLGLAWDGFARGPRAARFVMLSLPGRTHPLIPRPFSISDLWRKPSGQPVLELLQKPIGVTTRLLSELAPGARVDLLGLLGNGFPDPAPDRRPVLLAGGIGNAPFAYHVRELLLGPAGRDPSRIVLFLAARRAEEVYIQPFVRESGITIVEVTDDGSLGEHGRITEALARRLDSLGPIEAFACGPTPMLRAVQRLALEREFPCHLSVEEVMACGYGVCNACVVEDSRRPGEYKKACTSGPVFECREIVA